MNTLFLEFPPSPKLHPYVQTYWMGNFNVQNTAGYSQSVLPNGCIELIIHTTNDYCSLTRKDEIWSESPEFILLGLFDKPYEVKFSNNVKVFGIRFYPDGIRNLFGIPPSEFLSTYEDGSDVLGKDIREFGSKIRECNSPDQQVNMAEQFLLKQLSKNMLSHDYTHIAMKLIRGVQGIADYGELTRQVPISVRQLQREFKTLYGITLKDYMRLTRLNAIHNYILSRDQNFTQLSYDLKFTDQSHFIREFKNYTGIAPKKFTKHRDMFIVNPAIYQ